MAPRSPLDAGNGRFSPQPLLPRSLPSWAPSTPHATSPPPGWVRLCRVSVCPHPPHIWGPQGSSWDLFSSSTPAHFPGARICRGPKSHLSSNECRVLISRLWAPAATLASPAPRLLPGLPASALDLYRLFSAWQPKQSFQIRARTSHSLHWSKPFCSRTSCKVRACLGPFSFSSFFSSLSFLALP